MGDIDVPSRFINIDVGLPTPQENMCWFGDIQMFWECSSLPKRHLGWKPFSIKFDGEYNSVQFDVPDDLWNVLNSESGSEQCRVIIDLNGTLSGGILLDNLGFIH